MTGTLELLETSGRDASLRRASGDEALEALHASEARKQAARSGDGRYLAGELGVPVDPPPPNHNPNNGGCDHDGEEEAPSNPDDDV